MYTQKDSDQARGQIIKYCIILAVLGFNFVGDGLRDALDPKMRR